MSEETIYICPNCGAEFDEECSCPHCGVDCEPASFRHVFGTASYIFQYPYYQFFKIKNLLYQ